jgi:hypothetical protein
MLVRTKKPELHITQKVAAENRHTGDTGNHGKAGNKSQPKERHSSCGKYLRARWQRYCKLPACGEDNARYGSAREQ